MIRILTLLTGMALLGACAPTLVNEPPEELGAFKLRVNFVYADKAVKGPVSRDATPQEWVAAIEGAVDSRLGRYSGPQEYDLGISLEGYMLAPGGVPVVFSPKSTAIVLATVYDVQRKEYLAKSYQIQVLEDTTGQSALLGSGHTRSREEQMNGLALKVADRVEEWMAEQHAENGWFNKIQSTVIEDGEVPGVPSAGTE